MEVLPKILESKMKIRFHDCDPFNHLNNSRYIDYMICAREDQLLAYYNFDVYQLAKQQGLGWVSSKTQIAYLLPVYLMEEVSIQTQLLEFTEKSLLVEALMWNNERTVVKSVMWAKLVHFDIQKQKSRLHSAELMAFFQAIVNPLDKVNNFENRINTLKSAR